MPKDTFFNLPPKKRELVLDVIKKEFEKHPISEASVKDIVNDLGIARGSFYTYFENLEESYFYILDQETIEVHELLLDLLREHRGDLFKTFPDYGKALARELFKSEKHALYRNRFLYWTSDLEQQWRHYQAVNHEEKRLVMESDFMRDGNDDLKEIREFIKAVIHALIRRLFAENWDSETFLKHYDSQVQLMEHGIKSNL
ncbi:TetR family transcriptional regulator [Proteiniclasticum sp. QWL-01]|uniref:TetR family transcriptional regulator n=1 Tax=Proteiniclasticum sp. QWL-01 TaxID=3036945 RepID=UPI00220555D9|nr:TetR family transcriptional regulator [Proteiniclasticum sp. QWL-01]UUM12298.1 TetR family transcriptional regulator [Clostridiaceae bacterium HFYG-1003]WFF73832.1 TetR family transcriptional regulator [Proteiniclasticum sp. QWL-01]